MAPKLRWKNMEEIWKSVSELLTQLVHLDVLSHISTASYIDHADSIGFYFVLPTSLHLVLRSDKNITNFLCLILNSWPNWSYLICFSQILIQVPLVSFTLWEICDPFYNKMIRRPQMGIWLKIPVGVIFLKISMFFAKS